MDNVLERTLGMHYLQQWLSLEQYMLMQKHHTAIIRRQNQEVQSIVTQVAKMMSDWNSRTCFLPLLHGTVSVECGYFILLPKFARNFWEDCYE
jgi:hypothetical protein